MIKFVARFIDFLSWLKISLSPIIIGAVVAIIIYQKTDNGLIYACVIAITGAIIGVIWATRIWRKTGTTNFIARKDASFDINGNVFHQSK